MAAAIFLSYKIKKPKRRVNAALEQCKLISEIVKAASTKSPILNSKTPKKTE